MAATKRKTMREMTVKNWIYLGIIVVVWNFVISPFVISPFLRWLGVPDDGWPYMSDNAARGLITVACMGVLVFFMWHVRRERRSPR